jgi:hypothetical protein
MASSTARAIRGIRGSQDSQGRRLEQSDNGRPEALGTARPVGVFRTCTRRQWIDNRPDSGWKSTGNSQTIDGKIVRESTEKGLFNSDGMTRDNFMACPDDEQAIPVRMDVFLGGRFFDAFRPRTVEE